MGRRTKRAGRYNNEDLSGEDSAAMVEADLDEECPSTDTCPRSGRGGRVCTASRASQCPFYQSGEDTDDE